MAGAVDGFKERVDRPPRSRYTPGMSLVLALLVQDVQPHVFDGLKAGDRVEITLKNRYSFTGLTFNIPPDKNQITVKLLGYPDVTGTITFKAMNVRGVRRLKPLSDSAYQSIIDEIKDARARLEEADAQRKLAEADRARKRAAEEAEFEEEQARLAEELAAQKKARDFYARFPAEKGWNEKKYEEIKVKTFPTPEETQFYNSYELWQEGKGYVEGDKP